MSSVASPRIVAALAPLAVALDELSPMPGNPRRGNVAAVARSLDTFGQRKPIVARRDGTVIAGNHTLAAARELEWSEIAVVYVDDDDTTAKAYSLADNRTAELGGYDSDELTALLGELVEADLDLFEATAWTADELAAMLAPPPFVKDVDTSPMLDEAASFSVIVACDDETHQATLLDRFARDGLNARPLMM